MALMAGCFRPMLAEQSPSQAVVGEIVLPDIDSRLSRVLVRRLEDRLGRGGPNAVYRLEVDQQLAKRGLLVAQDNAITRIQLLASATYRLFRVGEAEPALSGTVRAEAGYDETTSLFASRAAERDVEERLSREIAEQIARRILARAGRLQPA
ncbi:MAG: LPS assembly lipoprotein LptE [Pseudomonadota bacterium]